MKGQELINIVSIFQQWFRVHIHILKKIHNDLLELFIHLAANPLLHNANHLIVMLNAKDQIPHPLDPALVTLLLKLLNHRQDVLSVVRVPEIRGQLMR